jgi:hypothetical protein
MRAFFHFPLGRAEKVKGVKKIKLGRNEGRGASLVAGTGEPEAAQARESRGGAARRRRGGGAKKIKASTFLCKPFSILHIAGEPFNGHAENAGKYDKFIIGYKAQAGFYAADRLAPYAKTGHLEFGGKCVLREALCGAGLVDSIAGDIGLALVCINLQTFSPRFT